VQGTSSTTARAWWETWSRILPESSSVSLCCCLWQVSFSDDNDERPDRGFCQKVPQSVCAVAYDRYLWLSHNLWHPDIWSMMYDVWCMMYDERPDRGFCQKVPQSVCAVAYDRYLGLIWQPYVLYEFSDNLVQLQLQKWVEVDDCRRTTAVSLLELLQ